jgi:uncharacterized membrane protein YqjE
MATLDSRRTDDRPTLGALVTDITRELSLLVRGEIELAKAEMRESARNGAQGAGMLAVAAALAAMVGLLVTWAAVYGLTDGTGLPLWASFLIVAAVYLLVAVIVGAAGARSLQRARGPEQAKVEMQRTKDILAGAVPSASPAEPSAPSTAAPGADAAEGDAQPPTTTT